MNHIRKVKEKRLGKYETVRRPYSDEVMGKIAMIDAAGGYLDGVGYRWEHRTDGINWEGKYVYRLDPAYNRRTRPQRDTGFTAYGVEWAEDGVNYYIDGQLVGSGKP